MTTIGALIGLMLSVFLIIKKIAPAYSLIAGAIVGGLLGGLPLVETVKMMTEGVKRDSGHYSYSYRRSVVWRSY